MHNDRREGEIRACLDLRRPDVVLVPKQLARLALSVATGVLACLALVLLTGCAARVPLSQGAQLEPVVLTVRTGPFTGQFVRVLRFDDTETGATCYLVPTDSGGYSIACITGAAGD